MAIFAALSIASQALLSNTTAINTTNKNISNVYNEDYSREEAVFSDVPGGGVSIETIRRIFDRALFRRFISQNQENASLQEYRGVLEQVESVFNDLQGSGFAKELEEFFSVMNDIAVNPDDIAARAELISVAKSLVGRIRDSYDTLQEIKSVSVKKIKDQVKLLNEDLAHLAEINKNIKIFQSSPEKLNTYLNERDKLLKEISGLIETKITFNEDGSVNVYTAKGFALVIDSEAKEVTFEEVGGDPKISINGTDLTGEIQGGSIGGLLKGVSFINDVVDKLNTFTSSFANRVNLTHEGGLDLYGNTGTPFFLAGGGASPPPKASNIIVNPLIEEDPKKIAAAKDPNYLNSDNQNILDMIELKDGKWPELNNMSFEEYYTSEIVTPIGTELEHTKNLAEESQFLLESIDEKVKELSSVNMDEELVNLTRFQRAYEAAARIVTVTDELLQTILGMVG
ncbi:flagellar hook-associated protein FlgK [Phorcysia thermohydrogeniphila]|uniref:Flagellar hook-associated protein 1 n=1 Tax=Phorcysia thermohydrogeniphila TaxID=936138 RepID=A0A4R1GAH2_9BACT|nr:flagellar hook-associated protein FlgK [Phorcysia thermohydrogeniphila]TCK05177.1 flagellar hook-associated protein 1 FlgK [Phorcysia thermohydrogeniphila]